MLKRMGLAGVALTIACSIFVFPNAVAQERPECGKPYEIGRGDSLYDIAQSLYGDAGQWSRIFYANRDTLGDNPGRIYPGQIIVPPCEATELDIDTLRAEIVARDTVQAAVREEAFSSPEAAGSSRTAPSALYDGKLSFLTADDFRPFTDRSLPAGGMITEIIASAMRNADIAHEIIWINDRSAHLAPLLERHHFDFGFPWAKPDCDENEDGPRCRNLLYSAPVFEVLIKFFKLRESSFEFEEDSDVEGRKFCRPAGYDVSDLDADGRNWLRDGKIVLFRPDEVKKCFELLLQGKVDAVAINEFTGLEAVAQLDIGDEVAPALRAISTEPLHVVIDKRHPRASVLMFKLNEALEGIRENGDYRQTVSDHLALFWRDNG